MPPRAELALPYPSDAAEQFLRLYSPHKARTTIFDKSKHLLEVFPPVTRAQILAGRTVSEFAKILRNQERGGIFFIGAPMSGGKSTILCLLFDSFTHNDFQVEAVKHVLDIERHGPDIVSNADAEIRIPCGHYESLGDIRRLFSPAPGKVLLVDEVEFMTVGTTDEIDEFVREIRSSATIAVFAGLDFDFRPRPWEITEYLLGVSDLNFVLPARCSFKDCGQLAFFTQRTIDGEPAPLDAPKVLVGKVAEDYFPMCEVHHQVKPPRGGQ